jgi:hypothetical protein
MDLCSFYPIGAGREDHPALISWTRFTPGDLTAAVQAQEAANEDVVAAMNWLKKQPEVDVNRIVQSTLQDQGAFNGTLPQ